MRKHFRNLILFHIRKEFVMTYPIQDIARYIGLTSLIKGLSVSPLKLQKLLYYVQAWYMVFYGKENVPFSEKPQAWVNGPVYPSIYHMYKDKAVNMCDHLRESAFYDGKPEDGLAELTSGMKLDFELLESIILLYGSKTQNDLIFMTHSEKPWVEKREGLRPFDRSERELSLDTMYDYYKERHDRNRAKA